MRARSLAYVTPETIDWSVGERANSQSVESKNDDDALHLINLKLFLSARIRLICARARVRQDNQTLAMRLKARAKRRRASKKVPKKTVAC